MLFVLLSAFPSIAWAATLDVPPQTYDDAAGVVAHSARPATRYAYRKGGVFIEAADDDIVVAFEDDAQDWVASAYDHRGLRLRLESSRGSAADIVRNAMGDVTSVAYTDAAHSWSATFSRDRLGLEIDRVVGSGASAVRGYWLRDALGRPTLPSTAGTRAICCGRSRTTRSARSPTSTTSAGSCRRPSSPKDGGEARVELRNPDDVGNALRK